MFHFDLTVQAKEDMKYIEIDRYCVCGVETIYFNVKVDSIEIITIVGRQHF